MTNPALPNRLASSQVIDAGTYGVRAYITITNSDGTFLIWHSTDDQNNNPPQHLYIEKRIAFLSSAVSQGAAVWVDHTVYYEPGAEGETNQAKKKITNIMNILTSVGGMKAADFGFVRGTYTDENGTTVTFDDRPTSADYSFAASAFRQMPGTSPNIFSFEPVNTSSNANRQEKYRKNYNVYYFYGSLSVADSNS